MKTTKRLLSLLLSVAMVASLAACGTTDENAESAATETQSSSAVAAEESDAANGPITITDMSGDEVTIEGEVDQIINLWPAGTSSFFVMGAGDKLAGLAMNSAGTMNEWTKHFYPNCVNIPAMGGTTPTVEELINLNPDLVIIHPSSASDGYAQQIRDVGIPAINVNFSNYETMIEAYTTLGQILGGEYQEKLTTWCDSVQTKIEENRTLTADLAEEDKPVVYYISGQSDDLLATMGASSGSTTNIMQDWVESNGGRYAAAELGLTGNDVTAEEIFALNPDVIIVGGVFQHDLIEKLSTTDGWKDLDAVKNGRVYGNPFGCFNWDRFGLESLLQIDYALMCIQPEIAEANGLNEDTMRQTVIDFYKYYNGTEMTAEEADNMLNGLNPDGSKPDTSTANQGGGKGQGGGQGQGSGQSK